MLLQLITKTATSHPSPLSGIGAMGVLEIVDSTM